MTEPQTPPIPQPQPQETPPPSHEDILAREIEKAKQQLSRYESKRQKSLYRRRHGRR